MVFVLRRSAIIFAPSTFRPLLPKLQTGVEWTRQGVLTVGRWAWAAYSRDVRALFSLRPSERCLAASASSWFLARLQMRVKSTGVRGC